MKNRHLSSVFFSFFAIAVLSLFPCFSIKAEGFGKSYQNIEYEGVLWDEIYYDFNHLYLKIFIPHSKGVRLYKDIVSFEGFAEDYDYVVETTFDPGYPAPSSQKDFLQLIQEANPNFLVVTISAKDLGAKYAVDLIPVAEGVEVFWRFLSTNDRLLKMGTDDPQENRRQKFFDSIHIGL